ncbi:hypothetical protein BAUCODRAFT_116827 [Baudoinia panamericana UAMH 10762]|uniref:Amidase domain-containing protein n=1 Tax=Baudoinia panamericana (strain UAMH 10762) TaxID=717646 RepID=M2LCU8_BAUPA|nr:uncharacterized protein BAUCODRAFT_116827 [Baudoinia panamericana UAMH 10762]EMC91802.1 hypothetical protein BAUCODRAFT_116827 [Baudoinia panamericana UAMH 10762]
MANPPRPLWRLTATEILPLLHSGQVTVTDYAKSLLERIQARNHVKAWVWLPPSLILHQAKALDDIPTDERTMLYGLPIGIKDIILTKDMPTQYNSRNYESEDPINADASCILTLRANQALIFGKTTTTEFASTKQGGWHQNLTSNVHDQSRTPGGSSSGSAAAVADFQVPVALGTQTGGSIVRPASYNGCYGFKPTHGAISREGIAQWCPTLDTCGFFARTVEDLELLSNAFRILDDEPVPSHPFDLRTAKIGFCNSYNWSKAGPGTVGAMAKARDLLRRHGAQIEEVELPNDFARVLDWHAIVLAGEGQTSFLGRYLAAQSLLHESIKGYVENHKHVRHADLLAAYDGVARLRPIFDNIAVGYDVIITPSVIDEAPVGLEDTGDMSMCSTWTILHVPAINIPGFAGAHGMPIGLTAVTARYRDRHLLHAAKAIGEVFEGEGGWKASNL